MKSITAFGFVLAGVVASVFVSGHALAAIPNSSVSSVINGGATCHNYEGKDVGTFEFYGHGVTNGSPSLSKKVICPVTKRSSNFNGLTVRVNMDSPAANTVSCTLYAYNWNGTSLGSKAVKNKKSGKESLTIRVPSSTTRTYFSLVCSLPSKERSEIYSIESLD
ncbi:exported hypothetical protein [Crenothrix polyspora]|uniref:Secreted protein n=1 Tax=Crenothrix polyspora TaxID=360316 RepID=A0A1R4H9B1_9GAMM|nr:hypothetical protein [Crenothrix polyspora]SJM92825.1 exported hypothetical protein [Crenothrix polyspora]